MNQMKSACKNKKNKKYIKVPVIILTGYLAFSVLSTIVFYQIFFSRKVLQAEENHIYEQSYSESYPREELEFESCGNMLKGYLYGTENDKGIIIIANGIKSTAESQIKDIIYFVDKGWQVFAYDQTATGESDGDHIMGLMQQKYDVIAAAEYIHGRNDSEKLPIFVYGFSMGGYGVAASCDDLDFVEGFASLAGFNEPTRVMMCTADDYVGFLAWTQYPFIYTMNSVRGGSDGNEKASDAISVSDDADILIMIIENDPAVPYESSIYAMQDDIDDPNAVFEKLDSSFSGNHGAEYITRDSIVAERVSDYFESLLENE